jgi:hypothetical protein
MRLMTILINLLQCWLSAFVLNSTCAIVDDGLSSKKQETIEVNAQVDGNGSTRLSRNVRRIRTIPQFVLSRDVARGALYSLQASLSYALMLAVM